MKTIFFNLSPPQGAYGGGSFFVIDLSDYLIKNGYKVVYELIPDIDLLFIVDPRKGSNKKYDINDILKYKNENENVKILYAVNECDIKRQVSINIEHLIVNTIMKCDILVFISKWLNEYYFEKYNGIKYKFFNNCNIINNACSSKIFYPFENKKKINKNKIKIVTHHWSDNYNKGFYIYNKLAKYLENNKNIEFTYIGRYNGIPPKTINYIKPMSGESLANELRKHDIYLSASLYEPGGIHQLEGMSCGLPVLYRKNGGGIKETVNDAGEEFDDLEDMLCKLTKIIDNYDDYISKIDYHFFSTERFGSEYLELFKKNII